MSDPRFESFDPTPYQRMPNAPLRSVVTVSRALLELYEQGLDARVDKAAERLAARVEQAEAALTEAQREAAPPSYGSASGLDGGSDALWGMLDARLARDSGYAHPGLDVYAERHESPLGQLVRAGRARAERRQALRERLLGGGLGFSKLPMREQGQASAAILRLIDEDELSEAFTQLVGGDLLSALQLAQREYEAMLVDRLSQDGATRENLNELRRSLSRQVTRYVAPVLATLDEDEPESLDRIERMLAPVIRLREELSGGRGRGSVAQRQEQPGEEDAGVGELEQVG